MLPPGEKPGFLAVEVIAPKWVLAAQAIEAMEAEGFANDIFGGMRQAIQKLRENLGGAQLTDSGIQHGRVVVIGAQPVMTVAVASGRLVVYGHPGDRITLEAATSLRPAMAWSPILTLTLTGNSIEIDPAMLPGGETIRFIRARR